MNNSKEILQLFRLTADRLTSLETDFKIESIKLDVLLKLVTKENPELLKQFQKQYHTQLREYIKSLPPYQQAPYASLGLLD